VNGILRRTRGEINQRQKSRPRNEWSPHGKIILFAMENDSILMHPFYGRWEWFNHECVVDPSGANCLLRNSERIYLDHPRGHRWLRHS
jgi:hypothetical protein